MGMGTSQWEVIEIRNNGTFGGSFWMHAETYQGAVERLKGMDIENVVVVKANTLPTTKAARHRALTKLV